MIWCSEDEAMELDLQGEGHETELGENEWDSSSFPWDPFASSGLHVPVLDWTSRFKDSSFDMAHSRGFFGEEERFEEVSVLDFEEVALRVYVF